MRYVRVGFFVGIGLWLSSVVLGFIAGLIGFA